MKHIYINIHVYYVFVLISLSQNFCITFLLPRLPYIKRMQPFPISITALVTQTVQLAVSELEISKCKLPFYLHLEVIFSVAFNCFIYGKLLFVILSIIMIFLSQVFSAVRKRI